jgi:recombinational DNA repair protein RecR
VDARHSRLGVNEALFRTVNERVEELNDSFATVTERFDIVCECGDSGCVTQISITKAAYEQVRADPALFIVAPGHEKTEVERIVEERGAYHVVRKHPGLPEDVATETDPRR